MLNRRHIRIKVMQTLFAMHQSKADNLDINEKFLFKSIDDLQSLYLLMLSTLTEIQKYEKYFLEISAQKHLATKEEKNPNKRFIDNAVLNLLVNSTQLNQLFEDKHINHFQINDQYIKHLVAKIKESKLYEEYMNLPKTDFDTDKQFIVDIFTEIIAPDEKIYDFIENEKLTWIDDIPVINTSILKQLSNLQNNNLPFFVSKLYKNDEDKDFAKILFRKTAMNSREYMETYENKTRNWDIERVPQLDVIILNMAVCEFKNFPSIPVKVTINEYLEISKEYSTPKSSIFINGILDTLSKKWLEENSLNKVGRGLM